MHPDYSHWFLVCAWVNFIQTTGCFCSRSFSCAHSKCASKMSPNSWTTTKSYTFFIIFVFVLHLIATHFGFHGFCIKMSYSHSHIPVSSMVFIAPFFSSRNRRPSITAFFITFSLCAKHTLESEILRSVPSIFFRLCFVFVAVVRALSYPFHTLSLWHGFAFHRHAYDA